MAGRSKQSRTKKFEDKREQIMASAVRLFNEHGVKGATLGSIAEDVGLSLKSLRYYFKKKDKLAVACFLQSIEAYNSLAAQAAQGETPQERVRLLLEAFFGMVADIRSGTRPAVLYFGDIRAVDDAERAPVREAYFDMFLRICALLSESGRADRKDPGWNSLSARAHMLFSQLLWAVVWVARYANDQLPRLAERMYEILVHGLAPEAHVLSPGVQTMSVCFEYDAASVPQEAFLRTATRMINDRGYRGASVDRIAAELKVTKGSFYHHNARKLDLVVECFERTFTIMRRVQGIAYSRFDSGFDRVFGSAVALVRFQLSEEGPLLRTSALAALAPPVRAEMNARMNNVTDRFYEMLTDGMIGGTVRLSDAAIAAQMVTGMINAAAELHLWMRPVDAATATELYVKPLFFAELFTPAAPVEAAGAGQA